MSFIGIGSPIPEIANLPGQGGAIEVLLDYSNAAVCNDAATQSPSQAEPAGGVFSASPSGLNINTSTGVITPAGSTHGTYTITYTVSGESSSFTFTINPIQQSTFSYSSSSLEQYSTASPIFASGTTTGGTFSATSGLVINTTTGVLDLANSTIGGPYTVTYTTPGPCATSSTFNVSVTALSTSLVDNNFALSFNGTDEYVNAGNGITQLYNGAFSISYWVKQNTITGNQHHVMIPYNQSGWSNPYIRLMTRVTSSGTLEFRLDNWSNTLNSASGAITAGNWYHVCCTFDGTTNADGMKLYINAGTPTTRTSSASSITTSTNDLFLGTRYSGAPNESLNGDMDEVAIWSRALDATDVQRIYNGSSTSGKAANLFSTGLSNGLVYWNRMGD